MSLDGPVALKKHCNSQLKLNLSQCQYNVYFELVICIYKNTISFERSEARRMTPSTVLYSVQPLYTVKIIPSIF